LPGPPKPGLLFPEAKADPRPDVVRDAPFIASSISIEEAAHVASRARVPVYALPVEDVVERRILMVRGHKVMLDNDLARLYGVTTFNLNKAVKRNTSRFPGDFMFRLRREEYDVLIFQNGISKPKGRGGRRHLPCVFTEHGVAMLSSVLRSERAIRGQHRHHESLRAAARDPCHAQGPRPQAGGVGKEVRRPVPGGLRRDPATDGAFA
jgi:hypothetical protein